MIIVSLYRCQNWENSYNNYITFFLPPDQAGLSPTTPTPVPMTRPVSSMSGAAVGAGPVSHSSPRYPVAGVPAYTQQYAHWGY